MAQGVLAALGGLAATHSAQATPIATPVSCPADSSGSSYQCVVNVGSFSGTEYFSFSIPDSVDTMTIDVGLTSSTVAGSGPSVFLTTGEDTSEQLDLQSGSLVVPASGSSTVASSLSVAGLSLDQASGNFTAQGAAPQTVLDDLVDEAIITPVGTSSISGGGGGGSTSTVPSGNGGGLICNPCSIITLDPLADDVILGITGQDVTSGVIVFDQPVDPPSVPEPGTLGLFATALAGLGLMFRRRTR